MSSQTPTDLDLAALISSKICHDVIGPVGAIYNGLEILDEDDEYRSQVLRHGRHPQRHRAGLSPPSICALRVWRVGFAGALIDLGTAEQISRGYIGQGKHKLVWRGQPGHMGKDKVKVAVKLDLKRHHSLAARRRNRRLHGRHARPADCLHPL